jgi:K+:H+ antiporter
MAEEGETSSRSAYAIIVGYGVPGRAVAELAHERGIEFAVVEMNSATVQRCQKGGPTMIGGDARDPETLKRAAIDRATLIVVAVPDQETALQVTRVARALNGTARIVTRCHYTSAGFEARHAGANDVVIAEQVVASEMSALVSPLLPLGSPKASN